MTGGTFTHAPPLATPLSIALDCMCSSFQTLFDFGPQSQSLIRDNYVQNQIY